MAIKTFSTGEVLTSGDTNSFLANSGLVYISATTLSGSTTTVSNCFSSTYDNYLVVLNDLVLAGTGQILMQFATGTTDATANYSRQRFFAQTTATGGSGASGQTSMSVGYGISGSQNFLKMDISQPNLARKTFAQINEIYQDTLFPMIEMNNGMASTTTQYTGFVLTASGTTFTSGTLRVYGYRQA
jgi:hypothetical protein